MIEVTEGDICPSCNSDVLTYIIRNCSCHTGNPPCSACVNSELECPFCGWKEEYGLEFFDEGEFCI